MSSQDAACVKGDWGPIPPKSWPYLSELPFPQQEPEISEMSEFFMRKPPPRPPRKQKQTKVPFLQSPYNCWRAEEWSLVVIYGPTPSSCTPSRRLVPSSLHQTQGSSQTAPAGERASGKGLRPLILALLGAIFWLC